MARTRDLDLLKELTVLENKSVNGQLFLVNEVKRLLELRAWRKKGLSLIK